jgi:transposase
MTRSSKHAGLDVHQDTTVSTVREDSGRVLVRSVIPTEATALVEYFRGMRGTIHVAFEEGTQAQWLYELLVPVVHRVVVCNRRGERHAGNKGDHADADELSDLLRCGRLRAVYHGGAERAKLKELARTYQNVVEDSTRVMLRLKALFRARGIRTGGTAVYQATRRAEWLRELPDVGGRFRARTLYAELAVLQQLRPAAKRAMVDEARRDPAWPILRTIPFLGPVRVALLLATIQTPWRFRTKRHLWAYAGFAVVQQTTAEYELDNRRQIRRRSRAPLTRGLNRNHNRVLKDVFKGAATAAATRAGALQDWYHGMIHRGMREELARVTLARKLAAITLRLWKHGDRYDATQLAVHAGHAR